jgi:hypothetical protein
MFSLGCYTEKGSMTLPGGTFPLNPLYKGEKLRNPCLNRIK